MADNETYPLPIGLTFLFNLLLGTGVLTMPLVFAQAGYVTGVIVITALCFMSYIQVTFLVEAMANANFVRRNTDFQNETETLADEFSALLLHTSDEEADNVDEDDLRIQVDLHRAQTATDLSSLIGNATQNNPTVQGNSIEQKVVPTDELNGAINPAFESNEIVETGYGTDDQQDKFSLGKLVKLNVFNIHEKFELGDMTNMFLNKILSQFFFFSIIVYLFGDLMIYNTMMSKSLREISCTSKQNCNSKNPLDAPCWDSFALSRRNVYRIYLLGFVALLLPLIYAGLKKTQSIQVITIILRWLAFFSMVGISIKIFAKGEATGDPHVMNLTSVPKMFGICVYSFMCHHSVPSILTPIKEKRFLIRGLTIDYLLVAGCYLLIALTGIFAFGKIEDVYTLNFQINDCPGTGSNTTVNPGNVPFFDIFLPTYPIFTLFSSYTMIALTLINNMKVLAHTVRRSSSNMSNRWVTITFPLIAMAPPMIVSLFTEDVAAIVSYVGSYAGGLIQYVFPSLLVYYSRSIVKQQYLVSFVQRKVPSVDLSLYSIDRMYCMLNAFASPFQSTVWVIITAIWWILSLILVTVDHLSEIWIHE